MSDEEYGKKYEEELRDKFRDEFTDFQVEIKKLAELINTLSTMVYPVNLHFLNFTDMQIRIMIEDALIVAQKMDNVISGTLADGIAPALKRFGNIRCQIDSECNGSEPDPTYGVKNSDFVETE